MKGNAIGKYLVLLTCVLLFIAAVDTIPDPPAINPPGSAGHRISALYIHGPAMSTQRAHAVSQVPCGAMGPDRSPFPWSFETQIAGTFASGLVRHAADSSPPFCF